MKISDIVEESLARKAITIAQYRRVRMLSFKGSIDDSDKRCYEALEKALESRTVKLDMGGSYSKPL